MRIEADKAGVILAWGEDEMVAGGRAYEGPVPADFDASAGLGKYRFHRGTITEVEGWVAPVVEEPAPEAPVETAPQPQH